MSLILAGTKYGDVRQVAGSSKVAIEVTGPVKKEDYKLRAGLMVPDRGFVKQLKKLRDSYEVVWDAISSRWEIWDFPKGEPGRHITTVQTKNRSFRELGMDVLLRLQQYSWERYSVRELCAYLDEMEEQERRRKMKDFKNKIEAVALETYDRVRGVIKLQVPLKWDLTGEKK